MSDMFDSIQAFVDNEPVDPVALECALAEPEGRAHLVDIVVLRSLVKRSTAAVAAELTDTRARWRPYRWIAVAAAVVLVATLASVGGYVAGERHSASRPAAETGVAPQAMSAPGADAKPPAPAPAPTTIITFKPGVDWTERGGH